MYNTRERLVELVENARGNALWHNAPNPAEYVADMLISDGVTIPVRCKDCKKWEYDENFSGWCVEWRRRTLGNHFCSYGERREGE